jgi:hypothetical protein
MRRSACLVRLVVQCSAVQCSAVRVRVRVRVQCVCSAVNCFKPTRTIWNPIGISLPLVSECTQLALALALAFAFALALTHGQKRIRLVWQAVGPETRVVQRPRTARK